MFFTMEVSIGYMRCERLPAQLITSYFSCMRCMWICGWGVKVWLFDYHLYFSRYALFFLYFSLLFIPFSLVFLSFSLFPLFFALFFLFFSFRWPLHATSLSTVANFTVPTQNIRKTKRFFTRKQPETENEKTDRLRNSRSRCSQGNGRKPGDGFVVTGSSKSPNTKRKYLLHVGLRLSSVSHETNESILLSPWSLFFCSPPHSQSLRLPARSYLCCVAVGMASGDELNIVYLI